ncbi:MAG TPA: flagellar export protein FliJ [Syntrophobacteraceae bacterium]|nr:flagellar export protein FliJ [Syntrophobacteraceae bacterium]HBZ54384.1 flagellar export protein FliJ [Syntrophobacteraceae bacterium]
MAFHFRFQSLLRYRKHLRSEAQTELANAIRRHERAVQLLDAARGERRRLQDSMDQRRRAGISVDEYVTLADYLVLMERQLGMMEREVEQFGQEVLAAKEQVLQRQTDVKVLECLEVSDRVTYRKVQGRRERAQIDENAIVRDARIRREAQPQD